MREDWGAVGHRLARALAVALVALMPSGPSAPVEALPLTDRLMQTVPARMEADGVTGAVVVLIQGGVPVWTGAFGLADLAAGRPMRADALFRVESLSKPVTAWGAMHLAETGRLDLHAPITDCLGRWQPPRGTPSLTAAQLLSHSAGVGLGDFSKRFAPDASRPTLPDHLAAEFTLVAEPAAGFSYSDTGYNLLELLIEDCTGEEFGALMEREVLSPLGMATAAFDWKATEMPAGHDLRGRPVAPYVYPAHASGGLHATAADIARFAAAQMSQVEQSVLSAGGVAELHRAHEQVGGLFGVAADGYGLGFFTETLSDGRGAIWHGGQGYGWMSHMHVVPETGDGIVILSNSQRAWPLFAAIVRDWSESLGVSPAGLAHLLWAEAAARAAIVLALALAGLWLWRARQRLARPPLLRIGAGGVAAVLVLWPLWAAAQNYLFLFSILPSLWPWLGAASALAGLALAAVALMPERGRKARGLGPED